MKQAIVLKHAEFEGPAKIADFVTQAGYELSVRALHRGEPVPAQIASDDLLIVMGGPMGVGDLERPEYAFLRAEVELLERCIRDDVAVLGVCLGAQLLAHAAGARVGPMRGQDPERRVYEVGWAPLQFHLQNSADTDVLVGMPAEAMMLHWHGDTFDLPAGARLLASTAICRNQAFQLGHRQIGLQFHCETTSEDVERFLQADADFVIKANGARGVEELREQTQRHMASLRSVGDQLLRNIVRALAAPSSAARSR